jgi:alkyl sulfatase BDS1-like metallo-beta-lactamase superfamily hydrolase
MNKKETEPNERKDATEATKQANEAVLKKLPFDDHGSFELAYIGHKIPIPDVPIPDVWDPTRFDFIKEDAPAPDTVNPSLWRQSKLTKIGGLFEVVPGIYQVRNYDIANMTVIESDSGIIIVDVLLCAETAKAALKLYYDWKGEKLPVKAVIFTHSHLDHFGGVINGVTTMRDIKEGKVKVYAPDGFLNSSYMENFYMGNVMHRRASYMYGNLLPADEKGEVGAGLGTTMATGTVTLVPQKRIKSIKNTFEEKVIDGLAFEFQLTPGTEAPAEMNFFVPEYNALCTAENAVHTMHNVYSLRGAQIRDALSWSKDLNTALNRWGDRAEVYFGVHHWPVWRKGNVITYLKKQRDLYRYINDQTLRLANLGYKPVEIAEQLRELPPALENDWDIRGYYGSLNHNVKSVYVKHIGWFDGNPATLHTYPPCEAGKKYVQFMGGREELMEKARESFQEGDYRWVAEVVNHLIFAEPDYPEARKLQADALEQLGYQAESGPWRNFYLSGAQELRDGVKVTDNTPPGESFLLSVPIDTFLDYMGMLLKGKEVWDEQAVIYIILDADEETNEMEKYQLDMENGALNHTNLNFVKGSPPDLEISTTRKVFYDLIVGIASGSIKDPISYLQDMINQGLITYKGDITKFECILAHLQVLDPNFNIVEPIKPGDD